MFRLPRNKKLILVGDLEKGWLSSSKLRREQRQPASVSRVFSSWEVNLGDNILSEIVASSRSPMRSAASRGGICKIRCLSSRTIDAKSLVALSIVTSCRRFLREFDLLHRLAA
jgi:hypothetical protein